MKPTSIKLFLLFKIFSDIGVHLASGQSIIFAKESMVGSDDCLQDPEEYLIDSFDNLMISEDKCRNSAFIKVPTAKNEPVTTAGSIATFFRQMKVFDKLGFVIVSEAVFLDYEIQIKFKNQSIDGTINWRSVNLVGLDYYFDVFLDFDSSNQLHVSANQIWKFDNRGKMTANYDISRLIPKNFRLATIALTPTGNWVLLIEENWSYFSFYFYETKTKNMTVVGDSDSYLSKFWIYNETVIYASKLDPVGRLQLVIFNYENATKSWRKIVTTNSVPTSCYDFDILSMKRSSKFNVIASCYSGSIIIFGFPPRSENTSDLSLGSPQELFSIKQFVNEVSRVKFLEGTNQLIIQSSFSRGLTIGDLKLKADTKYWMIVNSIVPGFIQPYTPKSTPQMRQTSSTTPLSTGQGTPTNDELNQFNIWYPIAGSIIGLGIVCLSIVAYLRYQKRRRSPFRGQSELNRRVTAFSRSNLDSGDAETATTNIYTTSVTQMQTFFTLHSGQNELAIPGYLQVESESDVLVQNKIAQGGTATVYLAKIQNSVLADRCGSRLCIAKVLNQSNMDELESFRQEVAIMAFFQNNKNFVKIVGYSEAPPVIYMRQYPLGSLADWIHQGIKQIGHSSRVVQRFATNIISGIQDMHDANFVHCDIKPGNILINNDPQLGLHAVLTDFGITRILDTSVLLVSAFRVANKDGWSVAYCPPESFQKIHQGESPSNTQGSEKLACSQLSLKSTDIYMFGMTLYEMMTRKIPFSHLKAVENIVEAICNGERPSISWELIQNDSIFMSLSQIMTQCWNQAPELRPTAFTVLQQLKTIKTSRYPERSERTGNGASASEPIRRI